MNDCAETDVQSDHATVGEGDDGDLAGRVWLDAAGDIEGGNRVPDHRGGEGEALRVVHVYGVTLAAGDDGWHCRGRLGSLAVSFLVATAGQESARIE